MERKIVDDLSQVDFTDIKVPMAVIYKNSSDVPGKYVVRLWEAATGQPTNTEIRKDSLWECRAAIMKGGNMSVRFERAPHDDQAIVESWI